MRKLIILMMFFPIFFTACKKDNSSSGNATEGTFTDSRDSKTYRWAKIGTQTWMIDNLAFNTGGGNWAYDNVAANATTYGYLYSWAAAQTAVPSGWHIPTDAEWQTLKDFLGGNTIAGGKTKQTGTALWSTPNTGATNESKWNGIPGGQYSGGSFVTLNQTGLWWSKTEPTVDNPSIHFLQYNNSSAGVATSNKTNGFSVRCIKN